MHLRVLLLALMLFSSPALSEDARLVAERWSAPPDAYRALPGQATIDLMRSCQGRGYFYDLAVENGWDIELYSKHDLSQCLTYINGIVDMNAEAWLVWRRGVFCSSLSNLYPVERVWERVRVFLKWTDAHPELLHESRGSGVIAAFAEAFPCVRFEIEGQLFDFGADLRSIAGSVSPGQATIDLMRSCQGRGLSYDLAVENGWEIGSHSAHDLSQCLTYISGIVDMNAETQRVFGREVFCPPRPSVLGSQHELRMAFLRWAAAHPELLHESKRSGVIAALFPCK